MDHRRRHRVRSPLRSRWVQQPSIKLKRRRSLGWLEASMTASYRRIPRTLPVPNRPATAGRIRRWPSGAKPNRRCSDPSARSNPGCALRHRCALRGTTDVWNVGPVRDDPALTSSSPSRAQRAGPTVAIARYTSVATNRAEGHPSRAPHRPRANMIKPLRGRCRSCSVACGGPFETGARASRQSSPPP